MKIAPATKPSASFAQGDTRYSLVSRLRTVTEEVKLSANMGEPQAIEITVVRPSS